MQRFLVRLALVPSLLSPAALLAADAPATQPPSGGATAAAPAKASTVLTPVKNWFAPSQPIEIKVNAESPVTLTLTDFAGAKVDAKGNADVEGNQTKDVKGIFPNLATPGTWILYAVPKGKDVKEFVGTPLVIEVRADNRQMAAEGPVVVKVEALKYAVMTTSKGAITIGFYYDVAPNTVSNFLGLAAHGFYNGLTFHRIISGFMIQGGDPRGDGMGGPGYQIDAEFNPRPHLEGVLSMARSRDPNSAGSQFFICLDYTRTKQLDGQYTTFGRVTSGQDIVKAIGAVQTNPENDKPTTPVTIDKVEVKNVTATDNPYTELQKMIGQK